MQHVARVQRVAPHQRQLGRRAGIFCAFVLAASAATGEAQETVTLHVTAGLGGLVKPGRWAPVLIDVESPGSALSADLVVTWGDATLSRRVAIASAGRRHFELYLRTAEAESVVRVRVDGATPIVAEAAVTVVSQEEPVTLCIATLDTPVAQPERCSVMLAPERLPSSLRAYEIVDEVVAAPGVASLPPPERTTLERWRSLRQLETSGDLTLTSQVTRPMLRRGLPPPSARAVAVVTGAYIAGLLIVGLVVASRMSLSSTWIALGIVLIAGTGAALAVGRFGPASRVRIHHTSLVQQLPGTTGSLLTLRGIAEFPAPDTFNVRLPINEAMIEPSAASGRAAQRLDDEGFAELAGSFGLGGRQLFTAEALLESQWLRVDGDDRTIQISNRSSIELRDCRFAAGLSVKEVGTLAPGAAVTAQRLSDFAGPLFTCTLPETPVSFDEDERAVDVIGTTQLVVYRHRPQAVTGHETPND